jgi:hypothetical protein
MNVETVNSTAEVEILKYIRSRIVVALTMSAAVAPGAHDASSRCSRSVVRDLPKLRQVMEVQDEGTTERLVMGDSTRSTAPV